MMSSFIFQASRLFAECIMEDVEQLGTSLHKLLGLYSNCIQYCPRIQYIELVLCKFNIFYCTSTSICITYTGTLCICVIYTSTLFICIIYTSTFCIYSIYQYIMYMYCIYQYIMYMYSIYIMYKYIHYVYVQYILQY